MGALLLHKWIRWPPYRDPSPQHLQRSAHEPPEEHERGEKKRLDRAGHAVRTALKQARDCGAIETMRL